MKKVIIIIIVIAVLAAIFSGPIRYRAYTGDRIKGTLTFKGCQVPAADDFANCDVTIKDNTAVTAIKAGEYGKYSFDVKMPDDTDLTFVCYQYNWWNVTKFDLDIVVSDDITVSGKASCITEAGFKEFHTINKVCHKGEKTEIRIVSL